MTWGIKKQLEENQNVDHTIPISTIMEECLQDNFVLVEPSTCPSTSSPIQWKVSLIWFTI